MYMLWERLERVVLALVLDVLARPPKYWLRSFINENN
jgi:hypothetical protein